MSVVPVLLLSCSPRCSPRISSARTTRVRRAALMTCGGRSRLQRAAPACVHGATDTASRSGDATRTASSSARGRRTSPLTSGRRRGPRDARPRRTAGRGAWPGARGTGSARSRAPRVASRLGIVPGDRASHEWRLGVSAVPADARQGDDELVVLSLGRLSHVLLNPGSPELPPSGSSPFWSIPSISRESWNDQSVRYEPQPLIAGLRCNCTQLTWHEAAGGADASAASGDL